MKAYRIKHIQSGLYYRPARGRNKSNLSTHGNVYLTKNSPFYDKSSYIHIQVDKDTRVFNKAKEMFPVDRDGFEVYHEVPICENIIDAAYGMLCWCIENSYIPTSK